MLGQYCGSATNPGSLLKLAPVSFKQAIADYVETVSNSRVRTIGYHFNGSGLTALLQKHFGVTGQKTLQCSVITINHKGIPYVVVVTNLGSGEVFTITESY